MRKTSVYQQIDNLIFLGKRTLEKLDREDFRELAGGLLDREDICDLYNPIVIGNEVPRMFAAYLLARPHETRKILGQNLLEKMEDNAIEFYRKEMADLLQRGNEYFDSDENRSNRAADDAIDFEKDMLII
jgi:hypothetical protein